MGPNRIKTSYKINNIIDIGFIICFIIDWIFKWDFWNNSLQVSFGGLVFIPMFIYAGIVGISIANRIRKFTKNKNSFIRYFGLIFGTLLGILLFFVLFFFIALFSGSPSTALF